ncbi:MAG: cyclic nucleotide-binding domain-containing protein [Syntrophobacteraceae bacterium]|nr:cyclic nucleotide-binding domain-containing protein [Syntrophobacteraceae bacterium]
MDIEDKQTLLQNSIFSDLPGEELAELARTLETRVAQPDEMIFEVGDPADAFYIIGSGQVRIFVKHKNRAERELTVRGEGEHFGEVSLMTGEPRTANAQSLAETHLLVASREQFERLIHDYPELSRKFVREIRGWLLEDEKIIEEEAEVLIRSSGASWFDFVIVLGVSILLAVAFNFLSPNGISLIPEQPDAVPAISASQAMNEYSQGKALIVDAMPNNFYRLTHIKGSLNLPPAQFDILYMASFPKEDKSMAIVVYGSTISAPYDLETAGKLLLRGYSNVRILEGGLKAWEAGGYPVEKKVSR